MVAGKLSFFRKHQAYELSLNDIFLKGKNSIFARGFVYLFQSRLHFNTFNYHKI
ncbi:hypothetical protein HMPREF0454_03635 [Hafnia alvei ATCC 51873]|uniref:Uncharacterized protein n=1 Tax=Hafnia alvei ATCC 51873 TaxID=1002364 RepID=G9YAL1_HAFAL|nr:hypothetical protein HMPREF0454_03635 [Hafnia alvei ATCC 51873]